jgi:hypothetical protein
MIVSLTRDDLREEFAMADQAFALSPISARAAQPSEEDYAAISEAFMETARGRWFLGEYAKRNRNADTTMVLDAVARIEQSLAAQKQAAADETGLAEANLAEARLAEARLAEAKLAEAKLAEVLAAIRSAVEAARASALEALEGLALEQQLAPVRKGARVIREIAWRLREIGNDGRICDLIDSQVSAIETGAGQITSDDARAALSAAFGSIAERLAEFGEDGSAPAPAAEEAAAAAAPLPAETPAAVVETAEVARGQDASEALRNSLTSAVEAALAEPEAASEAADADDEAVLDMIALEMGAPDPADFVEEAEPEIEEAHLAASAPVEPEIVAAAPEPAAAPIEPPFQPPPSPEPALEISLGSTIIASGIVRKPHAPANDPLAPIRRMSQAEKIAFFS